MTTHTFIHFCASGNTMTMIYAHDGYYWSRDWFWKDDPTCEDTLEAVKFDGHILGWMHDIAVEVAYGNTAL